jgi:hypothetical protein
MSTINVTAAQREMIEAIVKLAESWEFPLPPRE